MCCQTPSRRGSAPEMLCRSIHRSLALVRARPEMQSRRVGAASCARRSELAPPLQCRRKSMMCRSLSRFMGSIAQTRSLSVLGAPRLLDPQNRKPGRAPTRLCIRYLAALGEWGRARSEVVGNTTVLSILKRMPTSSQEFLGSLSIPPSTLAACRLLLGAFSRARASTPAPRRCRSGCLSEGVRPGCLRPSF